MNRTKEFSQKMSHPLQRGSREVYEPLPVLSVDGKAEKDFATSLDGAGGDCDKGNVSCTEVQVLGVSAHTWSLRRTELKWGQGGEARGKILSRHYVLLRKFW